MFYSLMHIDLTIGQTISAIMVSIIISIILLKLIDKFS